jgi:hypothetical protein
MIEDMDLLKTYSFRNGAQIYRHSVMSSHWLSKSQEKAGKGEKLAHYS